MKTIDHLMAEFYEAFQGADMPPVDGTIRGMLADAWHSGRHQAIQFALESNQATVRILEGTNKMKTPYVIGAINALTESARDWESILSGEMVPTWPT